MKEKRNPAIEYPIWMRDPIQTVTVRWVELRYDSVTVTVTDEGRADFVLSVGVQSAHFELS
jgi:hypothetical protein